MKQKVGEGVSAERIESIYVFWAPQTPRGAEK